MTSARFEEIDHMIATLSQHLAESDDRLQKAHRTIALLKLRLNELKNDRGSTSTGAAASRPATAAGGYEKFSSSDPRWDNGSLDYP